MYAVTLGEFLAEFYRKEVNVPLHQVGEFRGPFPAGAPAIFADTLAKLGSSCGFIGVIGEDDFGKIAVERFEKDGVDTSHLVSSKEYTTGTSFVSYFEDGTRKFLFHLSNAAAGQLSKSHIDSSYISEAEFLHVTGSTIAINESCREAVYEAVEIADINDVEITFDPNIRPELLKDETIREVSEPILKTCSYILPNENELRNLSRNNYDDITSCARELLEKQVKAIIVKRGKEGALIITESKEIVSPPFSVDEVDPTGAGDSFNAGFVHSLLEGKNLFKAVEFANGVGALSVTEVGGMRGAKNAESLLKKRN
ncbi:hypothetical protein AKJ40_02270 [candidate division MSBL1 archaeon SCGC-AAA259M10]|uniref:Carbohydrate kinase PfkB domain-containing protein n=3 Tax=candidate division MSBL1 TaxID=215777 RepID=A0A133U521_9EURY|nr:hypothetical protein AKJ61_04575 [candidate division MSBL1 archaeon SCGC-AAA259B11]KXA89281.1 hypothetical protein AKJ62_03440 [candidate division MSBL1 archaeon SCGC-AAA259D14]KXA99886.1 hypothetical protein AKJ40_02270 [candidate division MSBL1 archaeon SCGC-AAA259M10]